MRNLGTVGAAVLLALVAGCHAHHTNTTSTTNATFAPIRHRFDPIATTSTTATSLVSTGHGGVLPSTSLPATPPAVPSGEESQAEVELAHLVVAAPGPDAGYERDLFKLWDDADHDGCDARCEVLAAERRTDVPGVGTGWYSLYDGVVTADPSKFDIDHMVPLAEAWRSGASGWDAGRREGYANDLDLHGALIAVSASSNRSKGDRDPAEWRPPLQAAWCEYSEDWIAVKTKWSLTADPAEVAELQDMLTRC